MRVLWDTTQSSTSLPLFLFQFRAPLSLSLSLSFPPLKHPLQASYPRHILGGEAPSSMAYSLVDGASSHLFSFVFRWISMVKNHHWMKLKDPASIEASQASFHHCLSLSLHSSSPTFKLLPMASYVGELFLDSSFPWSGVSNHLSSISILLPLNFKKQRTPLMKMIQGLYAPHWVTLGKILVWKCKQLQNILYIFIYFTLHTHTHIQVLLKLKNT